MPPAYANPKSRRWDGALQPLRCHNTEFGHMRRQGIDHHPLPPSADRGFDVCINRPAARPIWPVQNAWWGDWPPHGI